ncbi:DUF11 domain-containing protein [Nonomuraea sp. PA05]|uniref:DUF7507 domain-containing protein n=1 Tax=Nonomuraea sp. PA05 TaxID=2604466 RepID=UPI0011DB7691|nr:DUF11 domain-containing protein [Nonomuraea sp. PA05]TYB66071.1 DUF11 domain-containing protein [Nonomuraea sp. PA05]
MGGRPGIAALIALIALVAPTGGGRAAPAAASDHAPAPAPAITGTDPSTTAPLTSPQPGPDAPPPGPYPAPPLPEDPVASPSPLGPSLHVTGGIAPAPLIAGTRSAYTLTITNTGDQPANDVILAAILDHNLTPGPLPSGCSLTGRTVTCGGPGLTIRQGRSTTYELPITTDPALRDGTPLTTRAHVTSPGTPDDETQLTTEAVTRADVELRKTAPPSTTQDGTITYTLTVTNHGPSQATDVTLRDPTQATIAARPAECPGGGSTLSCPIGQLPPNESRTLTFTVTPSTTGVIENCATVSTADREQRTTDNRSCADTLVEPAPSPSGSPRKNEPGKKAHDVPIDVPPPPDPAPAAISEATGKAAADRDDVPPPAHHAGPELPLTGASFWMLGLGVAVLLAIGLLVRYFSRRDEPGPES